MKVALITNDRSQTNYAQLNECINDLALVFKTPTELVLEKESYDFLIVEEEAISFNNNIHYLKEKISLDRVFLILQESKSDLLDSYLLSGVKDVFVLPINLMELAIKLKYASNLKKSPIFANTKSGMSLKQILIFEVLRVQGPQGATRKQIMGEIWDSEKVEPKNVDVHIHNLRKILKKQGKEIIWRENRWYLTG